MHFFVRFEPAAERAEEFRAALLEVVPFSRAESGCRSIHVFESMKEPAWFVIHSEWKDEEAFEQHARMPHTRQFVAEVERLLGHSFQGWRTRQIG